MARRIKKPTFHGEIKTARLQRKLTVGWVAEKVGVSRLSIYHWEHGTVRPRANNLTSLCKTLRLPVRTMRELAGA